MVSNFVSLTAYFAFSVIENGLEDRDKSLINHLLQVVFLLFSPHFPNETVPHKLLVKSLIMLTNTIWRGGKT